MWSQNKKQKKEKKIKEDYINLEQNIVYLKDGSVMNI